MISLLKKNPVFTVACTVAFICLLVYLRALSCGFVNWDDGDYVYNNPIITKLDWNFIRMIFTTIPNDYYIPLTNISFAIDYHFWGLNPTGYHLTNILLHTLNVGLFVIFADRLLRNERGEVRKKSQNSILNPQPSSLLYSLILLLAALLWGIHPLRVESVVWVTERKDVLNGIFTFGSLICYLRYVRLKEDSSGRGQVLKIYLFSVALFILSLMSKVSSIVLPIMLLIIDWYPLERLYKGRIRAVMIEKIPYLIFSLATVPVVLLKQAELGALHNNDFFPIAMRVLVSGNALFEYIKLMLFPVGILPFYNLPLLVPKIFIAKTIAALCFLSLCLYWGRSRRWVTATLLLFIIPLVPILPFLGNGASIALAARYTYLPAIMPSILAAVVAIKSYEALGGLSRKYYQKILTIFLFCCLIFYVAMTEQLIGDWKDSGAMWSKVIAYQPFDRAYFYRGLFYADGGNYNLAVKDYTSCISIAIQEKKSDIYNLYAFRAESLVQAGRFEEAIFDLNTAIKMFPHQLYFYYRALAFKGLGDIKNAEFDFMRAGRAKGKMCWFSVGSATY